MNRREPPEPRPPTGDRLPIEQYLDRLFAYAFRLTGSADLAEDLTQQCLLAAHQRIHQLRDASRIEPWLLRILRNAFLKSRRNVRSIPASQLDLAIDELADEAPLESSVDQEQLNEAISRLPESFRVVVLMFYFEDLSYREIAAELQLPVGTVMSRLSRAKGYLRRILPAAEKLTRAR